jgi:hypothetical protein
MWLRRRAAVLALVALPPLAMGCIYDNSGTAVVGGRVTLSWTIDGRTNPVDCARRFAPTLTVRLFFANGGFAGEYVAPCGAFATTIDVVPARYTAEVYLEDSARFERTTTIAVAPFVVMGRTNLEIPLDFPSRAFFD